MAKKNNSSLILWTLVSLIIGILLGLLITSLATTGQAKSAIDVAPRTSLNHNANLVLNQKMYDFLKIIGFMNLV